MKSQKLRFTLILAIGVGLMLPTLFQGFVVDDPMILSVIEAYYPERPQAFDVYSVLHDQWELPWWTSPDFELKFFRPLGSALLRLDYAVFGKWAPGWHLHSLLWLALFLAALAAFYQRLDRQLSWLVVLLFALDESSGFTAGWISNRHMLVAMTLGVAALWAHLRWREEGWRPGLPLACLGLLLSLLTAESGLVPLAFVFAYEAFAAPGSLRERCIGLAPTLALGLIYAAWYRFMGYGVHGGAAIYIDPGSNPLQFAVEACVRIPILLGGGILGVPPHLWMKPSLRPALVGIGLAAVALLLTTLKLGWSSLPSAWRRHLKWLLPGALFSCVPLIAAFPSYRQLSGPMLGIAPALAALFYLIKEVWIPAGGWRRGAAIALGAVLVLSHGILAPAMQVIAAPAMQALHEGLLRNYASVPHWDPAEGFEDVVVLQGPDGLSTFYGPVFLDNLHHSHRGTWAVLSVAPYDHRWTRKGLSDLELEILNGEMLTTFGEIHYPLVGGLVPGESLEFRGIQIRILAVGPNGPTKVAFHLPVSLEDPKLLLLVWKDRKYQQFVPPEVGKSVEVPYSPSWVEPP